MQTNDMTQDIIYTITNPKVTFNQRLKDMAKIAENSIELVNYTELSRKYVRGQNPLPHKVLPAGL